MKLLNSSNYGMIIGFIIGNTLVGFSMEKNVYAGLCIGTIAAMLYVWAVVAVRILSYSIHKMKGTTYAS